MSERVPWWERPKYKDRAPRSFHVELRTAQGLKVYRIEARCAEEGMSLARKQAKADGWTSVVGRTSRVADKAARLTRLGKPKKLPIPDHWFAL